MDIVLLLNHAVFTRLNNSLDYVIKNGENTLNIKLKIFFDEMLTFDF